MYWATNIFRIFSGEQEVWLLRKGEGLELSRSHSIPLARHPQSECRSAVVLWPVLSILSIMMLGGERGIGLMIRGRGRRRARGAGEKRRRGRRRGRRRRKVTDGGLRGRGRKSGWKKECRSGSCSQSRVTSKRERERGGVR
jgi:hypothetical protein